MDFSHYDHFGLQVNCTVIKISYSDLTYLGKVLWRLAAA